MVTQGWFAVGLLAFVVYGIVVMTRQLQHISAEVAQTKELMARLVEIHEARGRLGP